MSDESAELLCVDIFIVGANRVSRRIFFNRTQRKSEKKNNINSLIFQDYFVNFYVSFSHDYEHID